VVKERARLLRSLGWAKKQAFLQSQAGQVREVLVEGAAETAGWLKGLSDNYLRVALPGPPAWIRRRVLVRLTEVRGETLRGEALST
jgi:tRNA A37 methylthiotransferase MiaB